MFTIVRLSGLINVFSLEILLSLLYQVCSLLKFSFLGIHKSFCYNYTNIARLLKDPYTATALMKSTSPQTFSACAGNPCNKRHLQFNEVPSGLKKTLQKSWCSSKSWIGNFRPPVTSRYLRRAAVSWVKQTSIKRIKEQTMRW